MARTKQYEPGEVVEQAMHLFWKKGYGATSIEDLARATGLSRSSLYAEYGSKRELFSLAIGRYLEHLSTRLASLSPGGLAGIGTFFRQIASDDEPGCLMVNGITELGEADRDFSRDAVRYRSMITNAFTAALEAVESAGEIEPGTAAPRAELLTTQLMGLFVEQRSSDSLDLQTSVASTLTEVESWRLLSFQRRIERRG